MGTLKTSIRMLGAELPLVNRYALSAGQNNPNYEIPPFLVYVYSLTQAAQPMSLVLGN